MTALIGLRGLQRGDNFTLSCNRDDGSNFDNLVYIARGRRYVLQLEHADNPDKKKLTKEELVPLLQKCLDFYCDIINEKDFRDIPVDETEFIIYTNRELDPKLSEHKRKQTRVDIFYRTCVKEIFSFIPGKNKETDVYTILENSVKGSEVFHGSGDREMVSELLNKLIMVTCQNDKRQLDDELCKKMMEQDAIKVASKVYRRELPYFKTRVETWLRNRKEDTTANVFINWLQEAKTKYCTAFFRSSFESCTKKIARTGIKFSDSEISRLQAELSNKRAVHLRSDELTLCSILLLDCLPQSKCIFVNFELLQTNKRKLLHAWLGGIWEWLIVYCDSAIRKISISDMGLKIFEVTQLIPSKKCVVILTTRSVPQIQGFSPINHKFRLEQLLKNSQEMMLDKKIEFQGCKVTMRSVLQRHGNVEHILGPELVTDLITEETAVNIGGKLHVNTGYYEPRFLEREVWLQLDVLRNPDSYPDVFVVNGMEAKDLVAIVPPGETVDYIDQQNIRHIYFTQDMCSRFIVLSEAYAEMCFLELCENYRGRTSHWVQFKNGNLLWKKTHGGLDKLLNYIDTERTRLDKQRAIKYMERGTCEVSEESIWELKERIVLLVAEPGMGKSSTTTHVAWHTKKRDPTSWVVRINWKKPGIKLHEINAATFNLDSLVKFLCSAAFPDSKYTDINRSLLKQALQSSGNVTVLMDGFDELVATSSGKAAVILSGILNTKVARVWVTSRPVQRDRLEKELSVTSFSMKKLSHQSQVQLLLALSMSKQFRKEKKSVATINQLLMLVNQSVNDSNFTGSPLYIKMIATTYKLDIARWIRLEFSSLPRQIDSVCLYEKYVESKLHISLTEKERVDITNDRVLDKHKRLQNIPLEDFERCALVATLHSPMLESLHNKKIQEEIQPFLVQVQAGKDKTSVVMNVVEGKPQFMHPNFAEYFTARWFSKNFQSNRSVMEHILFDRRYRVVRDMFDRMLAKDCPRHCAVLDWGSESVETLLKEGCDANAVDKGGRTVMHIIAIHHSIFLDITNLVFQCGVSLDTTDCVLQWTPLQYAIKSENWFIVERLLETNVDRSGLDMIRQRVHHPDYIEPIIIHAATYGHLLLLKFIRSIGVNIHQASSMCFPSPLHAAVQGRELQVVRWLIKHGADCNTRYSDGQTALFDAVTEGSLDVVRALVEEGCSSVDVRDNCGRTAIDCANDYMSDPKNRGRILENGGVERLNATVKYLQERGCK
jgi:hypothetical protein